MKSKIVIIGAIKEEIAGIKQRMNIRDTHRFGHATVLDGEWLGHEILLIRSGMGMVRAEASLKAVTQQFSSKLIISIGYAGGLDPRLKSGDLLIAEKIIGLAKGDILMIDEKVETTQESVANEYIDKALLVTDEMDLNIHRGALFTVNKPVLKPEHKNTLGKLYSVHAVDMETLALARFAKENGTPFLSIRAISDTVDQELMDLSGLVDESGEVSKIKAGWYVVTHPGSLKGMLSLGQVAKKSTANLTDFISRFIKMI
ncbi:MAG: 5'-methylthioadenosine/S-adenosylhomocysteine nucleosidase [Nitrospinales bacterium]